MLFETHIDKAIMEVKPNQRSCHSGIRLDGFPNLIAHDLHKVWAAFLVEISGELGPHIRTHHKKDDHERTSEASCTSRHLSINPL